MEETEAEFERNYNKITCDTSFQSPILKKYVSTINDSVYYESDEQVYTISDSDKQVDVSSEPKEETHIIDRIRKLSVKQLSSQPSSDSSDRTLSQTSKRIRSWISLWRVCEKVLSDESNDGWLKELSD